jgi:hypothetical protein
MKKYSFFAIIFTAALWLSSVSVAQTNSALQDEMRSMLVNKVIILGAPLVGPDLKFEVSGKPVGDPQLGVWTIDSAIQTTALSLTDSSLEMDATRVIITPGKDGGDILPLLSDRKVHISLAIKPPIKDKGQIMESLGLVFSTKDLKDKMNAFWKPAAPFDKNCKAILKEHADGVVGTLNGTDPVYACLKSNVVTPPKKTTAPGPVGPDKKAIAGNAILAVVIDQNGTPAVLNVFKANDQAYTLAALNAMSQWKFKPATKDGKPVAYLSYIELGAETETKPDKDAY